MVGLTSEFGLDIAAHRLARGMALRSAEERRLALATIESVICSVRSKQHADYAIRELVQALENTQAHLLASLIDERARRNARP